MPSNTLAINAVLVSSRQAIDAICDRWSLTLILAMVQGVSRFNDLMQHTEIASRLLTARLRTLEESGVISRQPYSMHPPRYEYLLTNMGTDITEILLQMLRWERNWDLDNSEITHFLCGAPLKPQMRCAACNKITDARDIQLKLKKAQLQHMPEKQHSRRRSKTSGQGEDSSRQLLGISFDIFGDKWGIEIILCAFFRISRFNDFRLCTGIAANILADRLERLISLGILTKDLGKPSQTGYRLTEKGIDIYGVVVAVERWADKWLRSRYRSPVRLIHRSCGQEFRPQTVCSACEKPVDKAGIRF